jgi:hypothetical protein
MQVTDNNGNPIILNTYYIIEHRASGNFLEENNQQISLGQLAGDAWCITIFNNAQLLRHQRTTNVLEENNLNVDLKAPLAQTPQQSWIFIGTNFNNFYGIQNSNSLNYLCSQNHQNVILVNQMDSSDQHWKFNLFSERAKIELNTIFVVNAKTSKTDYVDSSFNYLKLSINDYENWHALGNVQFTRPTQRETTMIIRLEPKLVESNEQDVLESILSTISCSNVDQIFKGKDKIEIKIPLEKPEFESKVVHFEVEVEYQFTVSIENSQKKWDTGKILMNILKEMHPTLKSIEISKEGKCEITIPGKIEGDFFVASQNSNISGKSGKSYTSDKSGKSYTSDKSYPSSEIEKITEDFDFFTLNAKVPSFESGLDSKSRPFRINIINVENSETIVDYSKIYFGSGKIFDTFQNKNLTVIELADTSFLAGVTGVLTFTVGEGDSQRSFYVAFGNPFIGEKTFSCGTVFPQESLQNIYNKVSGKEDLDETIFLKFVKENSYTFSIYVKKQESEQVKYGDKIILIHNNTKKHLHSHPEKYEGGSRQQQVTCYDKRDKNDFFIIHQGNKNSKKFGEVVNYGELVRFEHVETKNYLHSHSGVASPTTKQQEVSCFWERDQNDDWTFEKGQTTGEVVKRNRILHVLHVATKMNLHSHDKLMTTIPGIKQQEVTCFGGSDTNDDWFIE